MHGKSRVQEITLTRRGFYLRRGHVPSTQYVQRRSSQIKCGHALLVDAILIYLETKMWMTAGKIYLLIYRKVSRLLIFPIKVGFVLEAIKRGDPLEKNNTIHLFQPLFSFRYFSFCYGLLNISSSQGIIEVLVLQELWDLINSPCSFILQYLYIFYVPWNYCLIDWCKRPLFNLSK